MQPNYNTPVHTVQPKLKDTEALSHLHEQLQDIKEPNQVLIALTILAKPVYRGTANVKKVAKRRAKNKVARRSRRATRK